MRFDDVDATQDPRSLYLVVAVARNRVIGQGNQLPWRLPADLRHFKELTLGHPIILGRRTHESIGRLLPGRKSFILSRDPGYQVPEALTFTGLDQAVAALPEGRPAFVIGGAQVYAAALPFCSRIHCTEVLADYPGDRFFPALDPLAWQEAEREHNGPAEGAPAFDFVRYERIAPA